MCTLLRVTSYAHSVSPQHRQFGTLGMNAFLGCSSWHTRREHSLRSPQSLHATMMKSMFRTVFTLLLLSVAFAKVSNHEFFHACFQCVQRKSIDSRTRQFCADGQSNTAFYVCSRALHRLRNSAMACLHPSISFVRQFCR
jgi:hypothetical protein